MADQEGSPPAQVSAHPLPLAPTPPRQQSEPRSSWRTWTGASFLAAGGSLAAWGIVWIALDGHSSSGSCSAGAAPGCVPVYNTKTPGILIAGVGAAAAITGGILLYTAKTHDAEVGVAVGPSSFSLAGRF